MKISKTKLFVMVAIYFIFSIAYVVLNLIQTLSAHDGYFLNAKPMLSIVGNLIFLSLVFLFTSILIKNKILKIAVSVVYHFGILFVLYLIGCHGPILALFWNPAPILYKKIDRHPLIIDTTRMKFNDVSYEERIRRWEKVGRF